MSIKLIAVLLFVAFNILSGWLKKRAQKKQAEALRNGTETASGATAGSRSGTVPSGASPAGATPAGAAETAFSAAASARKETRSSSDTDSGSDWEAVREDDETSFDVDGQEGRHPRKWQQDQSRDTRGKPERASPNALASQPGPTGRNASGGKAMRSATPSGGQSPTARSGAANPASRTGTASGEAPSARDLLTQLARDMGLKLPEPPRQSKPQTAKPSRTSPPTEPLRTPRMTSPSDDFLSNTQATLLAASEDDGPRLQGAQRQPQPGASPYRNASNSLAGMDSRLAADFADPESLRRAFILKTILDKPLSMQPRVPGF